VPVPGSPIRGPRKKPQPFQRPSIDLDRQSRSWQWVSPDKIAPGDVVAGFGMIEVVSLRDDRVRLTNVAGKKDWINYSDRVFTFTEAEPE
jgi:hypothetical protein